MINFSIDDFPYNIKNKLTVIQACFINKVDVPRFCFHEKLSIAGNCRMCLVEDENQIKPLASCAIDLRNDMNIHTNTLKVKKARESVLEFLLANHPLDCPICDQGGECDLQDQSMIFGSDRGRFYEHKRAVEDKDCGPLIKTIMNRCIHCTRCVRFGNEIAGTSFLGVTGRGAKMEIGSYIEKMIFSEISGNVIDLCPVGALTSKPFAFTSRSWELKFFNSIDVLDGMHSNIRIDVRGTKIMRVLPRINENINEEWITDKIRFSYDGFRRQRLYNPMILSKDKFVKVSWLRTLYYIKNLYTHLLNEHSFPISFAYINNLADLETVFSVKNIFNSFGSYTNHPSDVDFPNYYFNTGIQNLERADIIIIINSNLRVSYPLLNSKIRQTSLNNDVPCYLIGLFSNFNYYLKHISISSKSIINVFEGSHWLSIKSSIFNSQKPLFLFGQNENIISFENILRRYTNVISDKWNGINAVFSLQNIKELNMGCRFNAPHINFLLNSDLDNNTRKNNVNIYLGHHGDANALCSNVILPASSFIEKSSHYLNIFGNVQKTSRALFSVGQSRKDWIILSAIKSIAFNSGDYKKNNILDGIGSISPLSKNSFNMYHFFFNNRKFTSLNLTSTKSILNNYYISDSISKNSRIMSLCSNVLKSIKYNFRNEL